MGFAESLVFKRLRCSSAGEVCACQEASGNFVEVWPWRAFLEHLLATVLHISGGEMPVSR